MHEPPHSATMPSTPLKTAACMTLVPASMSSVVCFPSWLIYVTRGMVLFVLVAADGGPALRNPQPGVEHFSRRRWPREVYREKQPAREASDEGRVARIRCRHPCRADGGSDRQLRRSRFSAAIGR